ncbi:MAG: site-specific integrase, partial [Actinobacteria bacterium]|nr:site-specific integrase [Actinomycetota bacterium]
GQGFKRKKDAETLLQRMEADIAAGTYGKPKDISFEEYSARWIENYAALKVKPRTCDAYSQIIRNHFLPFFGKMQLRDITAGQVQEFITSRMQQGLSPHSVRKMVAILKSMFKRAEIWEYLKENPARFAESPRGPQKEMDYLTPREVRRFLDEASPDYYPLFATAVFAGARQGEILALRWCDIDFTRSTIFIRRAYHPRYGFGEPKTKNAKRAIVISPQLVSVLSDHKKHRGGGPDEIVFQNGSGKPVNASNMVRREFLPALERAGLRRIRFHDLRHTYAALMISLGENIKFIQKQMGHASLKTTMDTYGHLLPDVAEGFGARFDSLICSEKVIPFPDRGREMPSEGLLLEKQVEDR